MQTAFAETAEFYRIDASLKLDPKTRASLGQYMTPIAIGRFMASLFSDVSGDLRVLDPGAGSGALTAALVERLCSNTVKPRSVSLVCYEIEPLLIDYLHSTLEESKVQCEIAQIESSGQIQVEDFILSNSVGLQADFFLGHRGELEEFTHVIMNPPYKKIHSNSPQRAAFRKAGIETSNLYTGFMFLAAQRLSSGGEMVAIVPRSFCNGPYFRPFREQFFSLMSLQHIHIFEKRDSAFQGDEVLQENIIIHAVKDVKPSKVRITASSRADFEIDSASRECIADDMTQRVVDYSSVICPEDPNRFIHIATNDLEQAIVDRMAHFTATLNNLGLEVSTGPVVSFRLREFLRAWPEKESVPILYPSHFQNGQLEWPKEMKKPNAIQVTGTSRRWLWPNQGHFVITKRFTTKEEHRRIVASVYASDLPGELVGFENHLNVYHAKQKGFSRSLAAGLTVFLNSSIVDRYFRQFNGHTQVNATDLRSMRYPERAELERIGDKIGGTTPSQQEIDSIIEELFARMMNEENPLEAQQKIDDALEILRAFGMPRGQQNERSALTLLALLDVKPSGDWGHLSQPLMGITPIMEYCREHYGREYAPNTRETFRRQTMHQFVEAGIALYNPDEPNRPINSPSACYQISEDTCKVIQTFKTDRWATTLASYLETQGSLADRWARHREMQMIPVYVAEGEEIILSPGAHSELIKQIITEFAPRFAPGAEIVYVGDTGNKIGYFQRQQLAELGVAVDEHGKMPDVVLYYGAKGWLLLIESVTSHGPVDPKRHNELADLFSAAKSGLVYVTAFPDRSVMARYLGSISWETEVWCADSPTHLIHFDGERFLGPFAL